MESTEASIGQAKKFQSQKHCPNFKTVALSKTVDPPLSKTVAHLFGITVYYFT